MPEQNVTQILQTLARMEATLNAIASSIADHEQRIRKLEGRGAKRWDALTLSAITSIIVGVIGYFLGRQ